MEKGYKFRIYPNAEQVSQIEETFGACRWVWNYFLELRIAAWQANKKGFSNKDLMRHLTDLKKTVAPWLYDVSNPALQQT
ncbi:MAG: helix-turn-helix domain-containing protein, partial [Atopobiaceae bacterium]|nr:helix-turn-helix domain-containing protein [Atopobiaceae bacterium]